MAVAVLLGGAVAYLMLAMWAVALCRMAGRADREERILDGRPDPELESLGGFAVAASPVEQVSFRDQRPARMPVRVQVLR